MGIDRRFVLKSAAAVAAIALAEGCGSSETSSGSSSGSAAASGGGPGGGGPGGQQFTAVNLNTNGASPGGANTADVVEATNAFLDTLSKDQTSKIVYDFSDHQARQTWSNFPTSFVPRSGVSLVDLSASQRKAVDQMMSVALSQDGAQQDADIRTADDYLAKLGGRGASDFGANKDYFVAVYGSPSTTDPFMVQFGGHHLARNLTYCGSKVSQTPQFVGSEPTSFSVSGRTVQPVGPESSSMFGMLAALSKDELAAAKITGSFDDLQMGPGKDTGVFPTAAGLKVSELDADRRATVRTALSAYVTDLGGTAGARLLSKYDAELDQTRIGWANSSSKAGEHSYIRIDGPSAWIEFINTRSPSTPNIHYHSVYRDKTNDYGSSKPTG